MIDQLIIGDKASFDDFWASLARRKIGQPAKKIIKETIPFSNITYDFSAINGELYWEERELEYVFEIIAPTPEKLEELKTAFSSWVMNVQNEQIHDPFIPEHHFVGTYAEIDFEDEESLDKTTVTVRFTAYPYKVANYPKVHDFAIPAKGTKDVWILNESSHRMTPKITSDGAITLKLDGASYSMSAGTVEDEAFKLKAGANSVSIVNSSSRACNVSISFYEEVF